jgi:hypothetical protein
MGDYEKAKELGISADSICALLRQRFKGGQCVCASEVGARTSYVTRHVDFMAFHCWDSENYMIEAFEIKIAKSDLKRELEDPSKHNIFFDEIDMFWIVAPDFVLDNLDIIPPKWGVMKVIQSEGKLALRVARKPVALHDEQMRKRRIGRPFAASLCRAIEEQSETKRTLYEKQRKLEEEIRRKVEREIASGSRIVPEWMYEDLERCKRICEELHINQYYAGMGEETKKQFREAREIASRLGYLDTELRTAASTIKFIRSMIKNVKAGDDGKSDAAEALDKACAALQSKHGELWCVTYVEYGDSVDGKARVLNLFNTKEEAQAAMKEAAEGYLKDCGLEVRVFSDSASVGSTDEVGCEYMIEKIKLPEVPEKEYE